MAVQLSVVVSFFNEEETLPALIERLRKVLNQERDKGMLSGYELIFVNDSSTDCSEDILITAARGHQDIKIITMSRNFGVSQCVLAGMEYSSGELVVYMDADLQDPPEVIPEMLKAWREGKDIDVVNTVRASRKGEPLLKLLLAKIGYRILRYATNINFLVEAGDFKLLSRRAVKELIRLKEKQPFLRGLIYWIGFNQISVYYHRQPRYGGKSKFPLTDYRIIRNFLYALISFSDMPLHFAVIAGALTTVFAFFLLIFLVFQRSVLNCTVVLAAVAVLGGIQLLALGIVGLYVNAVLLERKNRPSYIVARTFGF